MSTFGGSIPDEITLSREEARDVLFALDDAIEVSPPGPLLSRLEAAASLIRREADARPS